MSERYRCLLIDYSLIYPNYSRFFSISLGKFAPTGYTPWTQKHLIEHLLEKKKKEGLKAVVFTFDIPPKKLTKIIITVSFSTNKEKQKLLKVRGQLITLLECHFYQRSHVHVAELLLHGL